MIQQGANMSLMADNSGFWRKLLNLKIPAKVKKFLWRASTGCLPTKVQLRNKRVNVNVECPVCNMVPKSIYHILVSCTFARACLNAVGIWTGDQVQYCFMEWLAAISKLKQSEYINKVVMLLWSLWKNMNDIVWKQKGSTVVEIVEFAKMIFMCTGQNF